MEKKIYNVAILGLGAIFSRHLMAINANSQYFKIIGIYDPIATLLQKYSSELNCRAYKNEEEVYLDNSINCIILLTPSNLHYDQIIKSIQHNKHVIVEKPATFLASQIDIINSRAKQHNVDIFTILQVRLNPTIQIAKELINNNLLGEIRGVSLIQRWQRPIGYFTGWRGNMTSGGGILREFGIHYLDAMQFLLGLPKVKHVSFYKNKFKNTDVSDTVYALFDFEKFGGSAEISIACEPKNLECSLSIMGSQGFLKLGGKSLDEIVALDLLDMELKLDKINEIKDHINKTNTSVLATQGASPYHPELYRQIINNPGRFSLNNIRNVTQLIDEMYGFESSNNS